MKMRLLKYHISFIRSQNDVGRRYEKAGHKNIQNIAKVSADHGKYKLIHDRSQGRNLLNSLITSQHNYVIMLD